MAYMPYFTSERIRLFHIEYKPSKGKPVRRYLGKNETFVETMTSTALGIIAGFTIGWGAATVLAVGNTALSYGAGKGARYVYTKTGTQIDLASGAGVNRICQ